MNSDEQRPGQPPDQPPDPSGSHPNEQPASGQPQGASADDDRRRRHRGRFDKYGWHGMSGFEHRHQDMFSARLVAGLLIIGVGAILLADNLGWFDARYLLRNLWPLALVAVGIAMVRNPAHHRSRSWGWVLITVGFWLFVDKIGWIDISLGQVLLPGLLLFVGGTLVVRSLSGPPDASKRPELSQTFSKSSGGAAEPMDHAEFVRSFALLSGVELRPVSRPFRGADLNAVMGGIKLDLTDARMEGDTATVEIFAFWGGVEIYVPPDWTVTSQVTTLLAGFIDKRRPTSVVPTKTLVVQGMVVMSGIEVKN